MSGRKKKKEEERRKKKNTRENNGKRVACGARNSPVPIIYKVGERVRLHNVATEDWALKGTIYLLRTTDDGRVVSYDIITDKGS